MRNVEQIGFDVKGKSLSSLGYYRDNWLKRLIKTFKTRAGQIILEPKFERFNTKFSKYKAGGVPFLRDLWRNGTVTIIRPATDCRV